MTNYITGIDALNMINEVEGGEHQNKFTKLGSGDRKVVKVLNYGDFVGVHTYSIFKKVNTFTPQTPPKLSAKGFPVENLTPFDKAWKYHQDQSQKFGDDASKAATTYRIKPRFAFGFYDLETGECIVIDFSKNQAQDLAKVIQKNEQKLGKKAFELEKSGSGTSTKVTLTPLDLDDLTAEQAQNFEGAPIEFDKTLFDKLYFEMDEEQMVEALQNAGFDVTKIGYERVEAKETAEPDYSYDLDNDPTLAF